MTIKKCIVIIGGARDYHVMDWYRAVRSLEQDRDVRFLTDLIGGEGFEVIVKHDDVIEKLFIIDRFLFSSQNKYGNIWRNFFKLLVLPIQIFLLKKYVRKNPNSVLHAQPMYYMFLCSLANVEFIGTPQGSEVLVRPIRSKLYRAFARKALQSAKYVTVDSQSMRKGIFDLSGVKAIVIQNGIDFDEILKYRILENNKTKVCSIRGFTSLYQIDEIISARNASENNTAISFIYPFYEENYRKEVELSMSKEDENLGRLNKTDMYKLLASSLLVISIPSSDSSPRSVYESIFLGACVAVTYNTWIEDLPKCMKERIFIVELDDINWFDKAMSYAVEVTKITYKPSHEAVDMFDQSKTIKNAMDRLYG
jgi:hypothetical protein